MEFHSWGTVPLNNDWLNINVSDSATKSKQSPSNFAEMLSNPVAFDSQSAKKEKQTLCKRNFLEDELFRSYSKKI